MPGTSQPTGSTNQLVCANGAKPDVNGRWADGSVRRPVGSTGTSTGTGTPTGPSGTPTAPKLS